MFENVLKHQKSTGWLNKAFFGWGVGAGYGGQIGDLLNPDLIATEEKLEQVSGTHLEFCTGVGPRQVVSGSQKFPGHRHRHTNTPPCFHGTAVACSSLGHHTEVHGGSQERMKLSDPYKGARVRIGSFLARFLLAEGTPKRKRNRIRFKM